MKAKTLGLIHTSATLVPVFQNLCTQYLPDVKVFNIVDDSLIKDVIARNELTKLTSRRVVDYVGSAEAAGADFILVTCSSIGAAIEAAAELTGVPVLRVDQPMADLAVKTGKRIGVIATLPTTLGPTSDLVKRRAILAGKEIELTSKLCDGAFEALMSGNAAQHDEMVAKALIELSAVVDVIVLAQASMSRVVDGLSEEQKRIPILASPALAIQHIADLLK
ncbi:aspartate/glutamate racemase family protein [Pedobacter sp. MC2016-14]|uniref:aspartate/glutamate racemase family protein n=1 Tax=Pedobacter sp. MC2016-14 TaxID=2897327 RepID=UPI001E2D9EBB|nr:aspartate/glutamate racemase family protein [Pedobacter sp. MC2016-14]MCD0489382.1 aspartate/glutamate racemase family protein [Pedobacter sp. MC2016-14]